MSFHGSAADVETSAAAAGFKCAPFGQPYGFAVVECRRGQPGTAEGDVIDVYSRADATIAGINIIAQAPSGEPAIADVAQIAFAQVLDPADVASIIATVRADAGTTHAPAVLAGGLQLHGYSNGPWLDHVSLLAPDLVAVWPSPAAS